jgi:Thioredoxin
VPGLWSTRGTDWRAELTSMVNAGDVKLVVHTLSFLDRNLPGSNKSSARSANAAACASDAGKFMEYHNAVFAAQPAREGEGYTDAQLTEFATTSGITGAALTTWQQCASSGQYAKYVTSVQEASARAEVESTPTVKLNGTDVTRTCRRQTLWSLRSRPPRTEVLLHAHAQVATSGGRNHQGAAPGNPAAVADDVMPFTT